MADKDLPSKWPSSQKAEAWLVRRAAIKPDNKVFLIIMVIQIVSLSKVNKYIIYLLLIIGSFIRKQIHSFII